MCLIVIPLRLAGRRQRVCKLAGWRYAQAWVLAFRPARARGPDRFCFLLRPGKLFSSGGALLCWIAFVLPC